MFNTRNHKKESEEFVAKFTNNINEIQNEYNKLTDEEKVIAVKMIKETMLIKHLLQMMGIRCF